MSECGRISAARWQRFSRWLHRSLLGFALLVAVVTYITVQKLDRLQRSWQRDVADLQRKALTRERVLGALERAQEQLQATLQHWRMIQRQVPEKADRPAFFQQLVSLADRCGLELSTLAPSGEKKRARYAEFYLKGDATGDYQSVVQFLWHFGRMERAARMTQLTVRRDGGRYRMTFTIAVPYGLNERPGRES